MRTACLVWQILGLYKGTIRERDAALHQAFRSCLILALSSWYGHIRLEQGSVGYIRYTPYRIWYYPEKNKSFSRVVLDSRGLKVLGDGGFLQVKTTCSSSETRVLGGARLS